MSKHTSIFYCYGFTNEKEKERKNQTYFEKLVNNKLELI